MAIPLVLCSSVAFAKDKISTATLNWPPYCAEDLSNYGFTAEIVTEAFRNAGYSVERSFMPRSDAQEKVKNGENE